MWPRSLAGQLMLVTALTLAIAQMFYLALLVNGQRHERISMIASGAATQISDIAERIAGGEPVPMWMLPRAGAAERRDPPPFRRGRGGAGRRIIVADAPQFRPDMADWPDMAVRVRALLEDGSGVREVRAAHVDVPPRAADPSRNRRAARRGDAGGKAVAVAARIADGRWITVRARVPNAGSRIGMLLIGQSLLLFGLMLGPLLFVAWRVSRPLARLAAAASEAKLGQSEPPLPETGPQDVRNLTAAFNVMRGRIWAMLQGKDRMLGAIGHDLRTPLTSLRVRVEQVSDAALRDKMAATIEEMAAIIDDILSLARAGQPREQAVPTDLAAMLAELVDEYQQMGRPVTLAAQGCVATRNVRASGLRRAMRNLIDNAVNYGGSATVGLTLLPDGSSALGVEDDGPGIAEELIEEMLEPFARAEGSRNRNTGGSGLGLALANAIAVAEGGSLDISSRVPKGLMARIILPPQT